jgi:TolB-like protein/lipoprotein NlpI
MIAQLGRLNPQKLGVIARSSAMHYKNADRAIDRVRQELGVEYVVEGSVRRAGDRVRITAQLIQVNDQTQLWAENYERDVKDIFALQRDVAERVAGSLTVELLPGAASTPARDRPIHPAAHEAHLRGRFHWNKRTPDGLRKAVEYFEQAVSLAPDWPLGYAGLADAYLLMPEYLNVRSSEAMPKARAAAARALEMDDALAEAHASMAYILGNFDWDWRAAEREFQRAIALNPNYATARQWYALHLRCNGRYDAAIRESIKAQESDPLSLIISNTVGWAYCCAGDFAQAEIRLRRTLELDADFAVAHQDLGVTLFLQGKFAEAIAEAREAVRLSDNDPSLSIASYGYICARAGQPEEARRILGELAARSTKAYVPPGLFVLLHAGLDDRDSMFDWLEKVYQEHDGWLPSTLIDPLLAEYRSDPRFVDLLHRVGLPMPTPKPIKAAESSATRVVLPPDVASIAVLPFTDLSAEKDQEYFADGLAEELLNNLVKVRGLRVAARTSSFQFRGRPDDIGTIGRKLNVGAILEGSVRKAGKRARITAQLINVADGFHLWSESYDRELEDIFAVQGDIARSVAKALKVTLLGQEEPQPAERSVNTEAYNAYLLGQHFRRRFTQEDTHKAIDYFQQAVKLDSGYAQAWVALGNAYMSQADSGSAPVAEGYAKAREAVERALGLDENLAIALSALGSIKHNYDWDWPGADAAHQKALALEPGNATVVRRTAELARTLGRFENAELLIRRALALDPLDVRAHTDLGVLLWYAGRADEAVAAYQNALELHPGLTAARWFLCLVYLTEGRPEAALTEFEQETDLGLQRLGFALTYHALGRKNDADAALMDCIQKYQVDSAFQIAQVYAFRGETDPAFEWLERAYAQRDGGLIYLKVDVLVKSLHGDPRYAALLQKMRLTP